jgi:predicted secreted protein
MRKLVLIAAIALVFGLVLSGCSQNRETIPCFTDPGQHIMVQAGRQFVIYLPYNPNTGFVWQAEYDESKLELVQNICVLRQGSKSHFLTSQGYDITEANIPPSAQYFQFRALAPSEGETNITMAYKNTPAAEPVETQTFTIIIQ